MNQEFEKKFFWGASTASHQVEGGNYNQWSVWEEINAQRLSAEAKKSYSYLKNWDEIKLQATSPMNYISGSGVDHYNRFEEDFDLARGINLNSLRFSIEWSRIEPREGEWNQSEIDHYKIYISEMHKRGLEPFLNVWHWTMPVWFTDMGGFQKKRNLKYFDRYTKKIAEELLVNVNYVMVLNEPLVYASMSYLSGDWPPSLKRPILMLRVLFNLIKAHKIAYKNFKFKDPKINIGIAAHITNFKTDKRNIIGRILVRIMNYFWNFWFLNKINSELDFIGVNHYFTNYFKNGKFNNNPKKPVSDMGWYMEPSSIKMAIEDIWIKYKKPIIISENGLADRNDKNRIWWLNETFMGLKQAKDNGVDLFGYLHWSLLDNFEWAYGWWPNFGLISVNRDNMERSKRRSADHYANFIKQNPNF
jgi:beta-glucosidase